MIPVQRHPGATVVQIHDAPIACEERERLRSQLLHLVRDSDRLIIDCSRLRVFGASFLGLLLSIRRQTAAHRERIALCALSPFAQEVLNVANLGDFWPVYDTTEDALEPEPNPIIVRGLEGRTELAGQPTF